MTTVDIVGENGQKYSVQHSTQEKHSQTNSPPVGF